MEYMKSIVEHAHITEMQEDLRRKLNEAQRKDLGHVDSLRSTVLSLVVIENYQRAIDEMVAYVELKSAFPIFQERAERYVQHCSELIQAIQTKRNFPGLANLSLSKQQEIHDKVIEHFEDLKGHLKRIERVEREQKLTDVRATVWVVQALTIGVAAIVGAALILDLQNGAFSSLFTVTNHYLDQGTNWVVHLIHL